MKDEASPPNPLSEGRGGKPAAEKGLLVLHFACRDTACRVEKIASCLFTFSTFQLFHFFRSASVQSVCTPSTSRLYCQYKASVLPVQRLCTEAERVFIIPLFREIASPLRDSFKGCVCIGIRFKGCVCIGIRFKGCVCISIRDRWFVVALI